jgi:hypothetical protein
VERLDGGRFGLALIGGEDGAKTIRGGEDQLREVRAMRESDLRSEHVFEFMRQLAQLVESTGRGIAFQSVYGATDAAYHILIRGAGLEFEPGLVERLKQFSGGLKKESAQLAAAILGRTVHELTSLRW